MRWVSDGRILALALVSWATPTGSPRAAVDDARVAEFKARMLAKTSTYQFELPSPESAPPPALDDSRDQRSESQKAPDSRTLPGAANETHNNQAETEPKPQPEPPPRSISDLLDLLLWLSVIAGAGLGVAYLVITYTDFPAFVIQLVRSRPERTDEADASGGPRAPSREGTIEPNLSLADGLAGRGEFGEAIHILLQLVFMELARRRDGGIPPYLTAREVLKSDVVPEAASPSLGQLVGSVELCLFGGRTANPEAFSSSRALCSDLLIRLGVHHE